MHRMSKLKLAEVNPYLICKLCNGYFIDPCTAQDCLHTFCKTCIVKHLYQHCTCPICGVVIHKTRPLEMIRHDQTMQDLVYKLVPGVFGKEMERRREFYADHPDPDPNTCGNSEERGEVKDDREILADDDSISVALVHSPNGDAKPAPSHNGDSGLPTTFLRCPANFSVSGMKKLVRAKYDLASHFLIDIFHSDESLSDDYTLMDIAYIYTWRRRGPLRIFYTMYQFDPSAASESDTTLPEIKSVPTTEPQAKTGSAFEISDSVTITELVNKPTTLLEIRQEIKPAAMEGSNVGTVNKLEPNRIEASEGNESGAGKQAETTTSSSEPMEVSNSAGYQTHSVNLPNITKPADVINESLAAAQQGTSRADGEGM